MGKTRDLLKRIRDTKGTFHAKTTAAFTFTYFKYLKLATIGNLSENRLCLLLNC